MTEGTSKTMNHSQLPETNARHRRCVGRFCLAGAVLAAGLAGPLRAQLTTSIFDGATPPAVEAGSAAGSYALSGFESVNLYSGKLDFALPLLRLGGRGEAGYTMTLRIAHTWEIETEWLCGTTNCDTDNTRVPRHTAVPMLGNAVFDVGYGPGLLTERTGLDTVQTCTPGDNCQCISDPHAYESIKLTRYTFTAPDGSATELRDEKEEGEPFLNSNAADCQSQPPTPLPNRGRQFVAADGSATIFADDEVQSGDTTFAANPINAGKPSLSPTGNLAFRNGTVYRIDSGRVSYIRDRNGNKVSFLYGGPGGILSRVTDSLGRVVDIAYDVSCGTAVPKCDKITYQGEGGASRVIEVHFNTLDSLLCDETGDDDCPGPTDSGIAGTGPKTYDELFPPAEKGGREVEHSTTFNPDDVVAAVKLPNGKTYSFTYNVYRELYRVTLPTGGVIEYDTGPGITTPACSGRFCPSATAGLIDIGSTLMIYRRVKQRREKSFGSSTTASQTFNFKVTSGCLPALAVGNQCTEVTVKSYDGSSGGTPLSDERHHFYHSPLYPLGTSPWEYSPWRSGKEFKTEIKSSGTTTLRRTEDVWEQRALVPWWSGPNRAADNAPPNDPRLARTDTYVLDGTTDLVSRVAYSYSNNPLNNRFNNRTDVKQYGYDAGAPGSLLNWLHTEYETSSSYTQSDVNFDIVGPTLKSYLPSVVTKQWLCGAGASSCPESAAVAKNEFSIDHIAPVGRSSLTGHDSSGFGTNDRVRGNRTQLQRWLNPGNTEITQTLTYDIAGNVTKAVDFNGVTTTISYTDSFTGNPQTPGSTYAFPTTITRDAVGNNRINHIFRFKYDYDLGRQTESDDENDYTTEFEYDDTLDRPTLITDPLLATTTFAYDDTNRIVTTTRQQDSCTSSDDIVSKVIFDGFGRQVRSEQHEDGAKCIATIQSYDGLGRIKKVGNPLRENVCDSDDVTPPSNSNSTRYSYDALGRVTRITHPDGSSVRTEYGTDSSSTTSTTTVTDEAGNQRKTFSDALDRITKVTEDPGGLGYVTSYSYDALDNLTRVTQGSQTRTFGYDSLGRLLCASNPESRVGSTACTGATLPSTGVDRYGYDDNSNLLTHKNARGLTVTTAYDDLNRPISISYSDTTTPPVTLCYDGKDFSGSTCTNSQVVGKKGRLTAARSSVSASRYTSFDKLGRVKGSSQQTGGATYSFSYSYNLAGGLESQTYPSGLEIETCYDDAGRIKGVSDSATTATTYASGFGYAPHGAVAELKLGNNLYEYSDFNTRLQPFEIGLGTFSGGSDKLKLEFTYGTSRNNNGNVLSQIITRPGLTALTQSYGYDDVNRLTGVSESGAGAAFSRTYSYDRYGNRAVSANRGLPTSPLMPTARSHFSTATNRLTLTGANYDNAGNQITTGLGETLAYDAENRLTSYTFSSATTSYKYGPQGRRVQKVTPTATETYVYDAFGKLAAEYSTAAPTSGGTFYRTPDHLGSTRLVTKQDQSDADCYDYAPFGEEIPDTLGSRSSNNCFAASFDGRHRFTGKERDSESDLDYFLARYYSGPMGRFLSVDPENAGADPAFPQTWNAYAYVANNPLKYVDRQGDYLETAWDVASLAVGVASLASNIKQGNYGAAAVDAVGVALDAAAVAAPAVPGGAGAALKSARAAQLAKNVKAGRAFENTVEAALLAKNPDTVSQITIKTKSGTKFRIDFARISEDGTVLLTEVKSSATAGLTKNQKKAFAELEKEGGVVVGQGKRGFERGTMIEPTKVNIVRPKDLEDL